MAEAPFLTDLSSSDIRLPVALAAEAGFLSVEIEHTQKLDVRIESAYSVDDVYVENGIMHVAAAGWFVEHGILYVTDIDGVDFIIGG